MNRSFFLLGFIFVPLIFLCRRSLLPSFCFSFPFICCCSNYTTSSTTVATGLSTLTPAVTRNKPAQPSASFVKEVSTRQLPSTERCAGSVATTISAPATNYTTSLTTVATGLSALTPAVTRNKPAQPSASFAKQEQGKELGKRKNRPECTTSKRRKQRRKPFKCNFTSGASSFDRRTGLPTPCRQLQPGTTTAIY